MDGSDGGRILADIVYGRARAHVAIDDGHLSGLDLLQVLRCRDILAANLHEPGVVAGAEAGTVAGAGPVGGAGAGRVVGFVSPSTLVF